jgi:glycosyltransferase 2 family protein
LLRKWSPLIGILITVFFLVIVFKNVDFQTLWVALQAADYRYVIPALAMTFTGYLVRTKRWQVILAPTKLVPFYDAFQVLIVGFMANNLLPARIGELVRAYILARKENISASLSLATIVVERVFDGITIIGFLVALSLVYPLPGWGEVLARGGAIVFGIGLTGIILLLVQEKLALQVLATILRPFPASFGAKVQRTVAFFIEGLHALRSPSSLLTIIVLSIAVWSLEALAYSMLILGFHLPIYGVNVIYAGVFLLTVINLGNIVPAAPGYAGSFEFFAIQALTTFAPAVASEAALALAVVSHAYQYILITGLGLFYLWRMGLSLRTLQRDAVEEEAVAPEL